MKNEQVDDTFPDVGIFIKNHSVISIQRQFGWRFTTNGNGTGEWKMLL